MFIKSFIQSDFGFRPMKVEVVLTPGLSQIEILGLPDQTIRESSKRILSAMRCHGFRIPSGKQVLVNLHPNYLRKTSQGLDFAIALGILLESDQVNSDIFDFETGYCYGTLSLKGEILVPEDLDFLNFEDFQKLLLIGHNKKSWNFETKQVRSLGDLKNIKNVEASQDYFQCQPPEYNSNIYFEDTLARLMKIVALGEHPLLIAGFAGCGKTTLVENLVYLLNPPKEKVFLESKKYWLLSGRELSSRPVVQPHHSATPIAVIGGGRPLKFGEISLAHGGTLILDELLEFHPQVQSALREPMEKGTIYLSRAGTRKFFPASSLVLATTNLCPCGHFQPGLVYQCRCSSLRLRNYVEKLTGPFLDRFAIFHLYKKPKLDTRVSLSDIKKSVEEGLEFRLKTREQREVNQSLPLEILMNQLKDKIFPEMIPFSKSHRRRQSLLRVARSLADLDQSPEIKREHLEESQQWTTGDIYRLEKFCAEDFAVR